MVLGLCALACVGIWVDSLRPMIWTLDGVLLFALIVERVRTPDPLELKIARRLPERVGLHADFERELQVRVPARAAGLQLEVRENFGEALEVRSRHLHGEQQAAPAPHDPTGGPDRLRLQAGTNLLRRGYRSRVRGVQQLGNLRLRLRGPLGLLERQAEVIAQQSIRIEPPLAGLDAILRLAASRRWQDLGVRRLRQRGGLTEFESLREYVVGDDPRLVDWKAFARRGYPVVREYQEERGQELIILVDGGRTMGATTSGGERPDWTKMDHALDTGLELAAVALQAGDRVGFAVFDRRLRVHVAAVKGARQLGRIKTAVFAELPSNLESDLGRALRELSVLHRRSALLVVISDVVDPLSIDLQRRALQAGSRRHGIVLATLDDPDLRALEEGRHEAPAEQRAVAMALAAERRAGLAQLRRSGARVLDTLPAETGAPLLGAWLDARRGRRAARSR